MHDGKRLQRAASKLAGLYMALYKDMLPFYHVNMINQDEGLKMVELIKEELKKLS